MRVGAYVNPTTYVVTGLRQMTLGTTSSIGQISNMPLWLCFVITVGFAALGMHKALKDFRKAVQ
jgi:hypothetical protein